MLPADIPLKPREMWTQIGKADLKRFDSKPKTNGTLPYTIDVQLARHGDGGDDPSAEIRRYGQVL